MSKIYLTTAIPYVNGAPHIGHAMDYCLSDVYARFHRQLGDEVRFQVGTDEHGNKIFQKATSLGMDLQTYVDTNAAKFRDFIKLLDVEYTDFIRTTDEKHIKRCQAIWQKLKPHIYASDYEGWYCSGCERFVTEKEYQEAGGICPDHQKPFEKLSETNYYLRISDFKNRIQTAIESDELLILPEFRKMEMLKLLQDAPDVSISRPVAQLSWGIPVPDDDSQVMYVWVDALANYLTVLGYPDQDISAWWPASAQFVGKDILRFHAIIWPAMLLALDLPLPKVLCSHGHVLSTGQKMSKSLGNVIDPIAVIEKHGTDAFRYFFLRHIDNFADSDFTWGQFEDAYNHELADDLGNLVQRLATLAEKNHFPAPDVHPTFPNAYLKLMHQFNFNRAFDLVWERVQNLNKMIDDEKPWAFAKAGQTDALQNCLHHLVVEMLAVGFLLRPFLPTTATKIEQIFSGSIVAPKTPLFPKNN